MIPPTTPLAGSGEHPTPPADGRRTLAPRVQREQDRRRQHRRTLSLVVALGIGVASLTAPATASATDSAAGSSTATETTPSPEAPATTVEAVPTAAPPTEPTPVAPTAAPTGATPTEATPTEPVPTTSSDPVGATSTSTDPTAAPATPTDVTATVEATATTAATAGALYQPVDPRRVMSFVPMGTATTYNLRVTGLPAGATAVQLNVTATSVTRSSFISVCATGTALDVCRRSSALNPEPGYNTPASVIVPLGGSGHDMVTFYNNLGSLQLVADVQGFYVAADSGATGALFKAVAPYRALSFGSFAPKQAKVITLSGVPAGATAVALNLTAAQATQMSYVSACPTGQALSKCAASSNLNASPGLDVANAAVVKLGGASLNQITLYNDAGTTSLIVDVTGYFVAAGSAPADAGRLLSVAPTRVMSFQRMGAGTAVALTVPNVPVGATAVALNITAAATTATSYVSACPSGTALSTCTRSSALNPRAGDDVANSALLKLGGPDGDQVVIYNNAGSTALVADLQGYFVPPASIGLPQPEPTTTPPPTIIATGMPGPTTTGVPAGTVLKVWNGDLTVTTPGTVIDGLDIRGYLRIKAANVTVKNSIIRGRDGLTTSMSLVQAGGYTGVKITDSELVAAYPSYWIDGFVGNNVTFTRVNIHGVVDTIKLTGDNVLIQDSWLHDNTYYAMTPSGHDTHTDNIQIQRGKNITVRNTVMSGARNAAMMITQDSGAVADVTWSNNHADGGACTINVAEKTYGPVQGLNISNNVFGYDTGIFHCSILLKDTTKAISTVANNVYTDGATVAVKHG